MPSEEVSINQGPGIGFPSGGGNQSSEPSPTPSLTMEALLELAVGMIATGATESMIFKRITMTTEATVELAYLVKQAVQNLFQRMPQPGAARS